MNDSAKEEGELSDDEEGQLASIRQEEEENLQKTANKTGTDQTADSNMAGVELPERPGGDNYEEVEMDIDSEPSSPAIFNDDNQIPSFSASSESEALSSSKEESPVKPICTSATDTNLEEEAMLRALLIKSLENRKKQKLISNLSKSEAAPQKERTVRSASPLPATSIPVYQPRMTKSHSHLNLADSSDEDEEVAPPPPVNNFLGGLDSFLKEARKSTEVSPKVPKNSRTEAAAKRIVLEETARMVKDRLLRRKTEYEVLQKDIQEKKVEISLLDTHVALHKGVQSNPSSGSVSPVKRQVIPPTANIKPLPKKIELPVDSDQCANDGEDEKVRGARRRSLLEVNPSPTPKIDPPSLANTSGSRTGGLKDVVEKSEKDDVQIPEGKSLARILKLQKQRVDEALKMFCQQCSLKNEDNQLKAISAKVPQLAQLEAYRSAIKPGTDEGPPITCNYRSPLLHFRSYRNAEDRLREGLSVLARGLEANPSCSDLWMDYLNLYSRLTDTCDYVHWARLATQHAPSFKTWWKVSAGDEELSHHLLETMVLRSQLAVGTGHLEKAIDFMRGYFVKSEGVPPRQDKLAVSDRAVLWLTLEEVVGHCRGLLQQDQSLVLVWLTVANLYANNQDLDAAKQVFRDAMEVNPHSAYLFNCAAEFALNQDESFALECLEACPKGYFTPTPSALDPLTLYSLLLEKRGPLSEVEEMYEVALGDVVGAEQVAAVWKGYLFFKCRQLIKGPCGPIEQRRLNWLLHRCIQTTPVRMPGNEFINTTEITIPDRATVQTSLAEEPFVVGAVEKCIICLVLINILPSYQDCMVIFSFIFTCHLRLFYNLILLDNSVKCLLTPWGGIQ
ncbi:hypothetical protein MAR_018627 [Mya arenaria]|uniref:Uncharacterized protein n=1 Tax=Mya arenaria TaxID=6604 RepID=A0ABY7EHN6_MYAAR|nr:hypothetical protein MAR_018627 [Mya arenaria]